MAVLVSSIMNITLHRLTRLVLLGILTMGLLLACTPMIHTPVVSQISKTNDCRVVQHLMGEACVPIHPQRVVVLQEYILANCLALNVKPIGSVFPFSYPLADHFKDKVDGIESVGSESAFNLEKILRLHPDLILAEFSNAQNIYKQLAFIAPTVVVLNFNASPHPPWQAQLEEVAHVLGKEDGSQRLIKHYWQRVEQLQQTLGIDTASSNKTRRPPVVSVAIANEWGILTYGVQHPLSMVLDDVGLRRPPSQQEGYANLPSLETLTDLDGDVLFLISPGREQDNEASEKLQQHPLWQKLNVVQRTQVYVVGRYWYFWDALAANAILDDLFKYLVNTP